MTDTAILKTQLIEMLNLKDLHSEDIDEEAPIFGAGLGLDSVDIVVLAMGIEKEYGVRIKKVEEARRAFASIRALASYIDENRV
jgi:acyl carrier protein